MHVSVQQRVNLAASLRARSRLATAEFYALIGKAHPIREIRFQIINWGGVSYHVVDRRNGKIRGICFSWRAALNRAKILEKWADGEKINIKGWSNHQSADESHDHIQYKTRRPMIF